MKTGFATMDITPTPGVEMCGYVARTQPSTGIHDPLLARALYLESGGGRLLWLHADVLGFEIDTVQRVKMALQESHGLRPEEVLLSATHTHSGPAVARMVHCGTYDPTYVRWLEKRLVAVAEYAAGKSEETEMVYGTSTCDLAIDRRGRETAHVDPRVTVFGFRRSDGSYAALVANAAVHNVSMSHENRLFSADMAGVAARALADLPGTPVVLFTNGACGNLNPPSVGSDFERMEAWGNRLAGSVKDTLGNAVALPETGIRTRLDAFPAARGVSEDEADAHVERMLDDIVGSFGAVADRCRDAILRWRRLAGPAPEPDDRTHCVLPIHTVVLNGIPIVAFGGELFSVVGDDLRRLTGQDVCVVGYANGCCGYVAPAHIYDEGGYEVDGAFVFYGTLPIVRGAYERARDVAAEQVKALCSDPALCPGP